ncbi:hypothetical protein E8E11_007448 [Didymella keratinophila]|nr:hypothetical protein E8E11_007448 [Didymella keratinophila]
MPPKKRAALTAKPSTESKGKRQKLSASSVESERAVIDITAQNACQSPLLRLLAELRSAIWDLAFGDKIIGVYTRGHVDPETPGAPFEVHYNWFERNAPYPESALRSISPAQLVCKQYWSEVSQVFLSSCTIHFKRSDCFLDFIISGHNTVSQVRRVKVVATLDTSRSQCLSTTRKFSTSAIGELRSLEGVELHVLYWGEVSEDMNSNIMSNPVWNKAKLPVVVRGFQQHKLKQSITIVFVKDRRKYGRVKTGPFVDAAAEIRASLLDYQPLRRASRRGKETQ